MNKNDDKLMWSVTVIDSQVLVDPSRKYNFNIGCPPEMLIANYVMVEPI